MTQPAAELRFVKGDAVLGDARSFCEQILKRFRTSTRMQAWSITQHAYAISAYCDDVTRTAIEDRIAADVLIAGWVVVRSQQLRQHPGDSRYRLLML